MKHVYFLLSLCATLVLLLSNTASAIAGSDFQAWLSSVNPSTVCQNNNEAVLTFTISGSLPPFSIQYSDGVNTFTVTSESLMVAVPVTPTITTTYTLISVSDQYEGSASVYGSQTLTVLHPPVITMDLSQDPAFLCPGESLSLGIEATGDALSYQWLKDGVTINNESAQTSTLYLGNFDDSQVGSYSCLVYGSCTDQALSSKTKMVQTAQNVQILGDLSGGVREVCRGASTTFSISALGGGLSYQWRLNGVSIENNETAQSSTLFILSADDMTSGIYDCVISSPCANASITSQSEVLQLINPVVILNQPVSQSSCPQQDVSFSIQTGGSSAQYLWRKNGEAIVNNPTAQSAQLVLTNVSSVDAGQYDVQVSNACMSSAVSSEKVQLNIYNTLSAAVREQEVGICRHGSTVLHVDANGQFPSYQWRVGGVEILDNPTAFTSTLVLNDARDDMSGLYDVVVHDICNDVVSDAVEVSVFAPVKLERQSSSMSVCSGSTAHADVMASGSVGRYQWYQDGVLLPTQTNPTLDLYDVRVEQSGLYYCTMYSAHECEPASLSSEVVQILVMPTTQVIKQPENAISALNGNAVFFVQSNGTGNIIDLVETYQWYKDGVLMIDNDRIKGTSSAQLEISNIVASDATSKYACRVHGACGTVMSTSATIVIPPVTIRTQPVAVSTCQGSPARLSASAVTSQDISMNVQWYKNSQLIPGATNNVLDFPALTMSDAGTYKMGITLGSKVTVFTNSVDLKILEAPVLDQSTPTVLRRVCSGSYLELNAPVISGNDLQYQWYLNKQLIEGADMAYFADYGMANTKNGDYEVRVWNGCSAVSKVVATVTTVEKTAIVSQPAPELNVAVGQSFSLNVTATGESVQYQWLLNGKEIPGAVASKYTAVASSDRGGYYSVRVFGSCGIVYSDNSLVNVSLVSDVNSVDQENGWSLGSSMPNPAQDEAIVKVNAPESASIQVEFFNMEGRLVLAAPQITIPAGDNVLRIGAQISSLPSGAYTLRLSTDKGVRLHTSIVVVH